MARQAEISFPGGSGGNWSPSAHRSMCPRDRSPPGDSQSREMLRDHVTTVTHWSLLSRGLWLLLLRSQFVQNDAPSHQGTHDTHCAPQPCRGRECGPIQSLSWLCFSGTDLRGVTAPLSLCSFAFLFLLLRGFCCEQQQCFLVLTGYTLGVYYGNHDRPQ